MRNSQTRAVILLAGMGSRLGRPYPKSLASLGNGESILSRQVRILESFGLSVCAVIGFKKDLIMEVIPDATFVYNASYDTTNTAKSLLCALRHFDDEDVLWLNGDVVFEPGVIEKILETDGSTVAVNNSRVAEEEIKYTLDSSGYINAISKTVEGAKGEALGINLVRARDLAGYKNALMQVDEGDYFERAMEVLIQKKPKVFLPVDVSEFGCVEVDFDEDLEAARKIV